MIFKYMDSNRIKGMIKKTLQNLAVVIAGLFVVFLAIEIFVRIFYPQERPLFIADSYIRTIHRPNVVTTRAIENSSAKIKTNAQGFLGEDFTIEKPENTYRIAMLGDSITEGFQIDFDKNFSMLLDKELNNQANPLIHYQVYNFGISGSSTIHELLTYRHYIKKYNPDLVVWQFFVGNDFADNLLLRSDPEATVSQATEIKWGRIRAFLSNDLHSPRFIVRNLEKLKKIAEVLHIAGISARQLSYYDYQNNYPFIYDIYNIDRPTLFDKEYDNTCDIIGQLKNEITNDTKMLSIIVPMKEELFPDEWKELLERYPSMKKGKWDFRKPEVIIEKCLQGHNMKYLNFYDIFKKLVDSNQPKMYFDIDPHINGLGHEIIAKELAKLIPGLILKK